MNLSQQNLFFSLYLIADWQVKVCQEVDAEY